MVLRAFCVNILKDLYKESFVSTVSYIIVKTSIFQYYYEETFQQSVSLECWKYLHAAEIYIMRQSKFCLINFNI